MSFVHSSASRVLINEDHHSGSISGFDLEAMRDLADVSTLLDTGHRFVAGLGNGKLTVSGLFDSTTGGMYEEINASVGVDDALLVTVLPDGFTIGKPAFIAVCDIDSYKVSSSTGDAVRMSFGGQPGDGVDWGVALHAHGAETANSNGTGVDNAASSANGGVASLHVTAYSGLTNIIVKVQHSTDNSTFADLITFATATAVTSERKTVTGTVNRYLRALWTVSGTGSATFAAAFARR